MADIHPAPDVMTVDSLIGQPGVGLSASSSRSAAEHEGLLHGFEFSQFYRDFLQRDIHGSRGMSVLEFTSGADINDGAISLFDDLLDIHVWEGYVERLSSGTKLSMSRPLFCYSSHTVT